MCLWGIYVYQNMQLYDFSLLTCILFIACAHQRAWKPMERGQPTLPNSSSRDWVPPPSAAAAPTVPLPLDSHPTCHRPRHLALPSGDSNIGSRLPLLLLRIADHPWDFGISLLLLPVLLRDLAAVVVCSVKFVVRLTLAPLGHPFCPQFLLPRGRGVRT